VYAISRAFQFTGLIVTGVAFFVGVLAGNVRREIALLAVGAALFFAGRWLQVRR